MRLAATLALGVGMLSAALPKVATAQQVGAVDAAGLRGLIEGMGYEAKALNSDAGKEKYEFTLKSGGLDVPVAAEISPSKNLIWLTVFLGKAPTDSTSPRFRRLLQQNFKTQPSMFYITDSGSLMMGMPLENRSMSAVVFRRWMEKLVADVASTKELWQ